MSELKLEIAKLALEVDELKTLVAWLYVIVVGFVVAGFAIYQRLQIKVLKQQMKEMDGKKRPEDSDDLGFRL